MPFTRLLNAFTANFIDSTGLLSPIAMSLLVFLTIIEVMMIGMTYFWDHEIHAKALTWKVITVNVLGFFILNWAWVTKGFVNIWVEWGLRASRGAMQVTDFTDPDNIAKFGFAATGVIWRHLAQYTAWEQIKNLLEIWTSGGAAFLTTLFYFGLGAWSMVTQIEFYFATVIVMLLLPWGVSGFLGFIAERAIGHMVASSIRLFVLSYMLGVSLPIMETLMMTAPKNIDIPLLGPSFYQALYALAGALALCMLCWRAGAFAMGFSYGGPQLTPRDVSSFVNMMSTQVTRLGGVIDAVNEKLGLGATPGRRI